MRSIRQTATLIARDFARVSGMPETAAQAVRKPLFTTKGASR